MDEDMSVSRQSDKRSDKQSDVQSDKQSDSMPKTKRSIFLDSKRVPKDLNSHEDGTKEYN